MQRETFNGPRRPHRMRPTLLEMIAAQGDPAGEETDPIEKLRAVVAAVETPADRLFGRYRGWASGRAKLYARHRD